MQVVGLAPCRFSRSEISPGAMVILIGGQVWNPLLGSSARSWKFCYWANPPLHSQFFHISGEENYSEVLVPSSLSPNRKCFFSHPLPFPFRNKPTPLDRSLPSDPAAGHSEFLLGGKVWEVEEVAHQFSFPAAVARELPLPFAPGTEPMARCASQDTCTRSPTCPGRRWDAPFPACPYKGSI